MTQCTVRPGWARAESGGRTLLFALYVLFGELSEDLLRTSSPFPQINAEKTVLKGQKRWGTRIYRGFYNKD